MFIRDEYIKKYDHPETFALISPYPKRGEIYTKGLSGIASFAKNTIRSISRKAIVITQSNKREQVYEEEGNRLIIQSYKANSFSQWLNMFIKLRQFPHVKQVLIQFDFALYGGVMQSSLIFPFLLLLRVFGYAPVVQLHSVIGDIRQLSGHVGLSNSITGWVFSFVYNSIFRLFYLGITHLAYVFVTEEILASRLRSFRFSRKSSVYCIPHGVDTSLKTIDQTRARKKLGLPSNEYVVLYFGYINWFKGADFFVNTFKNVSTLHKKRARFICAGGQSSTLKNKAYYKSYFTDVVYTINGSKKISLTGFVPQNKIDLYFSAADIVVFPYRYLHAASGVLAQTFAYEKPFVISEAMGELLTEPGIKELLIESGLTANDISFQMSESSLKNAVERVLKNGIKNKTKRFCQLVKQSRSWETIGIRYFEVLTDLISDKKVPNYAHKQAILMGR